MASPLLKVPVEILLDIADCLSRRRIVALLKTCRAMNHPLRDFLLSNHKNEMLLFAAKSGNLPLLQRALCAGADVSYCGPFYPHGGAALHRATHTDIVAELLRYNPPLEQLNGSNCTPLLCAVRKGHEAVANLLLAAGCNPNIVNGHETLLTAAIESHLQGLAITFIHQMNAYALSRAIQCSELDITRLMIARGITTTVPLPLHYAVESGVEYVKLCVDNGANINAIDPLYLRTAISLAATRVDTDVMRYLLQLGADLEVGSIRIHPLITAVGWGRTESVRALLEHGVDLVRLRDSDMMSTACSYGPRAIVELLLNAFANLELERHVLDSTDLLYTAVYNEQPDIVNLLLERGAQVDMLSSRQRESALCCAARLGMREIMETLLEAGADPNILCGRKTPLIFAQECQKDKNTRGLIMAVLALGGADISQLSKGAKRLVFRCVRQIEAQELDAVSVVKDSVAGKEGKQECQD